MALSQQDYPTLSGKRAVVVEDEGITVMHLTHILKRAGVKVVETAPNGEAGVEVVLREKPDLVLMDINMPVMSGLEAAERILSEFPTCIVMLTAYSQQEWLRRADAVGTCGYILKPVTQESLLPQLEAAFHHWQEIH